VPMGTTVMVAADMDFYPRYLPWAFVTPFIAGAGEDGKLSIDLPWDRQTYDGRWYTGLNSRYRGCTGGNGHTGVGIGTDVRTVPFCLLVQYVSRR